MTFLIACEILSPPTVANLNGHTIGGGIELALCCDIRIARPGAKFLNPEVMLGMVPGWMGIERVLNQVGPWVSAPDADVLGADGAGSPGGELIDEVVEIEQVEKAGWEPVSAAGKMRSGALAHTRTDWHWKINMPITRTS